MRFLRVVVGLCLLAGVSASACVRAQAKAPEVMPGLATPEPPERVIVPTPVAEPSEPTPSPPATPAPRPQTPVASSRPERTPPVPSTPAAVTPPPAPPADPAPVQLLQTTTLNPTEVEKEIHLQLQAAQRDLDRVKTRQLSADALKQYDAAKGFIRQAEDTMKAKNLALARTYADKAASLASQLAR